jgi:hypothetical protein
MLYPPNLTEHTPQTPLVHTTIFPQTFAGSSDPIMHTCLHTRHRKWLTLLDALLQMRKNSRVPDGHSSSKLSYYVLFRVLPGATASSPVMMGVEGIPPLGEALALQRYRSHPSFRCVQVVSIEKTNERSNNN